jgi:heme/copper-type cytochrome/quinol oxidase subunit 3
MTAIEMRSDHLLPPPPSVHSQVGWWGMVLFIINEAAIFASLIASYFYLGVSNQFCPPAGIEDPKLKLPLIMTACLVSSSVVLIFAEKGFEKGNHVRYRIGTSITILLGLAFLYLQTREYLDKLKHVSPGEHAYVSMFFTITGLHGAHVFMGLLMLAWALTRDLTGSTSARYPLAIKNTSLYWHFVDAVWLVILTSLYLSPRWY